MTQKRPVTRSLYWHSAGCCCSFRRGCSPMTVLLIDAELCSFSSVHLSMPVRMADWRPFYRSAEPTRGVGTLPAGRSIVRGNVRNAPSRRCRSWRKVVIEFSN